MINWVEWEDKGSDVVTYHVCLSFHNMEQSKQLRVAVGPDVIVSLGEENAHLETISGSLICSTHKLSSALHPGVAQVHLKQHEWSDVWHMSKGKTFAMATYSKCLRAAVNSQSRLTATILFHTLHKFILDLGPFSSHTVALDQFSSIFISRWSWKRKCSDLHFYEHFKDFSSMLA